MLIEFQWYGIIGVCDEQDIVVKKKLKNYDELWEFGVGKKCKTLV